MLAPTPMPGRLIIKAMDPETESEGGVLLPDKAQVQKHIATVEAMGPPLGDAQVAAHQELTVGDYVAYLPFAGTDVPRDRTSDPELKIVAYEDIIARLTYIPDTPEDEDIKLPEGPPLALELD